MLSSVSMSAVITRSRPPVRRAAATTMSMNCADSGIERE